MLQSCWSDFPDIVLCTQHDNAALKHYVTLNVIISLPYISLYAIVGQDRSIHYAGSQ